MPLPNDNPASRSTADTRIAPADPDTSFCGSSRCTNSYQVPLSPPLSSLVQYKRGLSCDDRQQITTAHSPPVEIRKELSHAQPLTARALRYEERKDRRAKNKNKYFPFRHSPFGNIMDT